MFTGIVEELGRVRALSDHDITIAAADILADGGVDVGDSVAVNGVCLTVTALAGDGFAADLMPETRRRTALDRLRVGSLVNLERALTLSRRLGGHLVSGHVDGVGRVASVRNERTATLLTVAAPPELLRYLVPQGSIALDGVSLTVVAVTAREFCVSLIPHTHSRTTLRDRRPGDAVNLEADILAKYVEKLLSTPAEPPAPALSRELLARHGF